MSIRNFNITVNGVTYEVAVEETAGGTPAAAAKILPAAPPPAVAPAVSQAPAQTKAAGGRLKINAPMPGNIMKIAVKQGDAVKRGTVLCILEAMKMENEICAPEDATVSSVCVANGTAAASGDLLFTLD